MRNLLGQEMCLEDFIESSFTFSNTKEGSGFWWGKIGEIRDMKKSEMPLLQCGYVVEIEPIPGAIEHYNLAMIAVDKYNHKVVSGLETWGTIDACKPYISKVYGWSEMENAWKITSEGRDLLWEKTHKEYTMDEIAKALVINVSQLKIKK